MSKETLTDERVQKLRKECVRRIERWPCTSHNDAAITLELCDFYLSHTVPAVDGWVDVKERLPEIQTPVLGVIDLHTERVVDVVSRSGNTGEFRTGYRVIPQPSVTHWRPLPPSPLEGGGK